MGIRLPVAVYLGFWIALASAQTPVPPGEKHGRVIGEVTQIDSSARQIRMKTDAGDLYTVKLDDSTLYLRVPPGEKDLKKATKINLADIGAGDRIYARGKVSEEEKSVPAVSVIVMTKADIAQKHEHDRSEWQRRGAVGDITAIQSDGKQVIIAARTPEGVRPLVIEIPTTAKFRRYHPDSVRFADAKPSSFAELKVGDRLRVLGDKREDGGHVVAQEIISGSFRTIAGTILSVNAATQEIKVTDLEAKQPLTVKVNADSSLRRLPPTMAAGMAQRLRPGGGADAQGGSATPGNPQARMRADGSAGSPGGGPPSRRPGGGDFSQMLERMPTFQLSELKPGDALIISSTAGVDKNLVTAITVVAGVEPLLASAPVRAGQPVGGTWNFDIGLPAQ